MAIPSPITSKWVNSGTLFYPTLKVREQERLKSKNKLLLCLVKNMYGWVLLPSSAQSSSAEMVFIIKFRPPTHLVKVSKFTATQIYCKVNLLQCKFTAMQIYCNAYLL